MQRPNWNHIWTIIRKYIFNKYLLTLILFTIIFVFVGEQSLINGLKRGRKIHATEQAIQEAEEAIIEANEQLNNLRQLDSLEQYAREHYLMHKENEDIFLIEEE